MATKLIIRGADFSQNAIVSSLPMTLNNDTYPVIQFDDGYFVRLGDNTLNYEIPSEGHLARLIYLDISEYAGCMLSFDSTNNRRWALYSSIDWLLNKVVGTPVDFASGFSTIENNNVTDHLIQADEKYLVAAMYINSKLVNNTIIISD